MITKASESRVWVGAVVGVALLLLAVLALHPMGMFVVFIPGVLLLAGLFLLYRLVARHDRPSLSERWADGQPLGRATTNEAHVREMERETRRAEKESERTHRHDGDESDKEAKHHDPADYQGPPPINPFP